MNHSTNHVRGWSLSASMGLALLLASTVQAQIAIQDGSLSITPTASANISRPFTVTAGADVMVVMLEDYGARLNEPATLTWNGRTLTRDVQTAYNNGNQRSMAIYHLFNPVAGTANITGTDTGVSETWVTAYTLSGVDTTIAPIPGNTNTGTVAAGVNSLSTVFPGVPGGAWAVVNTMFANASGLVGYSGTSGTATSVNDTNEENTDVSVGYVTNLSAGTVAFTATYTDTPGSGNGAQKANFAVDIFSPPSPPTIPASPTWSPASVVVGQTASITVVPIGTAPLAYQWMAGVTNSGNYVNLTNGGNISGATTATLTINNAQFANDLDYVVVVTNIYGAVTSSVPATLTVLAPASYLLAYPKAGYEISSSVYTLKAGNTPVDVVHYYNKYSYAHLAYEGTTIFTVSLISGATITSFDISPHSYGLDAGATVSGSNLTFSVTQALSRYLVVKISTSEGALEYLFIAADPPETNAPTIGGSVIDITDSPYYADNSGSNLMTTTIQNAINDRSSAGGGTIYFPAGVYKIGNNIALKSNVTLYLATGAVLRGSTNLADYTWDSGSPPSQGPQNFVINGNVSNVAFKGRGMIDANSTILVGGSMDGFGTYRKGIIHSGQSGSSRPNGIVIQDVTVKDATTWSFDIEDALNVKFENVKLLNDYDWVHSDGYDICSVSNAVVDNCLSLTGDDALDAKGTSSNPMLNITYSTCVAFTHEGCGTKIGDQATGAANNILFTNIDAVVCYRGMSISHDEGTAAYTNIYFNNVRTEQIYNTGNGGEFQVAPFCFWTYSSGGAGPVAGVSVNGCYIENTAGFMGIIQGYNANSIVSNVAFQGLQMDGIAITSSNYTAKINVGPNVSNVTFATLSTSGPPQIETSLAWVPSTVYAGQNAGVTAIAGGSAPLAYQWMAGLNVNYTKLTDGGNISGSTNATLTINSAQLTNALNYVVVVANSYGSITSSVAALTVLPTSPATNFTLNYGGMPIQEGVGSDWNNANVWNPGGLPASTSAMAYPGSLFELVVGSRVRNPAGSTDNAFPGVKLTVDGDGVYENGTVNNVGEIRFKNSNAGSSLAGGFYTTNYFPNLVLNGGQLNIGDNTSVVIQGKVTVATNSILYAGGGVSTNQTFQVDACLTGSGNIQVFNLNATNDDLINSVVDITGTSNTFTGTWDVEVGPLVGCGVNSLGSNTITINTNGILETTYSINNTNASLILNGRMFLTQTDAFNSVVVNGTPLAPGTYTAATLSGLYMNFPATFVALYGTTATSASGAIKVGNVVVPPLSPYLTRIQVSGTGGLTLSATNGTPGGSWALLESTNVALPLNQWRTNATGTFDGSGNLSMDILNTATNRQSFYTLKVQ